MKQKLPLLAYLFIITFIFLSCVSNEENVEQVNTRVTDIDGNTYKTIQIGNQIWMAENLKVTKDVQGNKIASYIPYNNEHLIAVYGRLYNWETALKVCPKEWRLPTANDWFTLLNTLDKNIDNPYVEGKVISEVGGKLKSTKDLWLTPNIKATNLSGFSAQPSGYFQNGNWRLLGSTTNFWSATEGNAQQSFGGINLSFNTATVFRGYMNKKDGHCVRCVKDVN